MTASPERSSSPGPLRGNGRTGRILAGLAVLALALLALTGCSYGYPHACDGHGGIRVMVSAIYYCNDGTDIGSGWLLLHPHDPRAQS